jgi:hypothetical protein
MSTHTLDEANHRLGEFSVQPAVTDVDWVVAHRIPMANATEDAGAFVSRMRDEDWR